MKKIKREAAWKVKKALLIPIATLVLAVLVCTLALINIAPMFEAMLSDYPKHYGSVSQQIVALTHGLQAHALIVPWVFIGIALSCWIFRKILLGCA